ncbi:MAG: carboxynorspermidine decarboxylase [Lachnospiraceae bacterium]|nr:carboxynorspermidine decarboxylase [Lachnospiraceae bacterium]
MRRNWWTEVTLDTLPTPCYVIDEERLEENLKLLHALSEETGAKILLAEKAFSCFPYYPMVRKYLSGASASGLFEAKLSAEKLGKQTHVFSPAYREDEWKELLLYADHLVFNSLTQLRVFGSRAKAAGKSVALRINPEHSTQQEPIYDPCALYSRLGVTKSVFDRDASLKDRALLDGLHFHTLCEQGADALAETLEAVEENWKELLSSVQWINFGGGHHITKKGYDLPLLKKCISRMQERYGLTVYLEPGEAVALNAGYLVTKVIDLVENGKRIAILDASAACHMPDVLEMPYVPPLRDAGGPGERAYSCLLGGPTCLASDVIGEYSFDQELKAGDRLVFEDMAIYTMVKNNTFNGMKLPAIAGMDRRGECVLLKEFGYSDFLDRLG